MCVYIYIYIYILEVVITSSESPGARGSARRSCPSPGPRDENCCLDVLLFICFMKEKKTSKKCLLYSLLLICVSVCFMGRETGIGVGMSYAQSSY